MSRRISLEKDNEALNVVNEQLKKDLAMYKGMFESMCDKMGGYSDRLCNMVTDTPVGGCGTRDCTECLTTNFEAEYEKRSQNENSDNKRYALRGGELVRDPRPFTPSGEKG